MFTGLVDHPGKIVSVAPCSGGRGGATGRTLRIESRFRDFALGESIACDGVCLTVEGWTGSTFEVTAGEETLRVTTLGSAQPGDDIHLERALSVGDRLGGHLVQGHVDGVGVVIAVVPGAAWTRVDFQVPAELSRYIAPKGSITVDGVSLTVNEVTGGAGTEGTFSVGLVPHTLAVTRLGKYRVGTRVNLETDLLARYLERLAFCRTPDAAGVDLDLLRRSGFSG